MPRMVPSSVASAASVRVGWSSPRGPASVSFARSKSSILTRPASVMIILVGFTSRWMMPAACAAARASVVQCRGSSGFLHEPPLPFSVCNLVCGQYLKGNSPVEVRVEGPAKRHPSRLHRSSRECENATRPVRPCPPKPDQSGYPSWASLSPDSLRDKGSLPAPVGSM